MQGLYCRLQRIINTLLGLPLRCIKLNNECSATAGAQILDK